MAWAYCADGDLEETCAREKIRWSSEHRPRRARRKTASGICLSARLACIGRISLDGIISRSGKTYAGICLDFGSSLGFCAEHAAIAEMLKAHESEISLVVAVDEHGVVLPPCGRCREMMWQLNASNKDALVILARDRALPLRDLLPFR